MKKIFIVLSTLALAIGCQVFEAETPLAPEKGVAAPTIVVSDLKDSSFVATITPAEGTGYYSYAIYEGKADSVKLSAATIFSVDKKAVFAGTSKAENVVVNAADLKPNTTYVVAAVAANKQGALNEEPATYEVTTSDAIAPFMVEFTVTDTVVVIKWSEPVVIKDQSVALEYAFYHSSAAITVDQDGKIAGVGEAIASVEPAEQQVSPSDPTTTTIYVDGLTPGAYFQVAIPEGWVEDAAGHKCAAHQGYVGVYNKKFVDVYVDLYQVSDIETAAIYGHKKATTFDVDTYEAKLLPSESGDWSKGWDTTFVTPSKVSSPYSSIATLGSKIPATLTIEKEGGYTENYSEVFNTKGGIATITASSKLAYKLPSEPVTGTKAVYTVGEGALIDCYGNKSNEFSAEVLYSYGFTIDDIIGTYSGKVTSPLSYSTLYGKLGIKSFTIEASDSTGFNVMITEYLGMTGGKIYGNANFDNGEITFEPFDYIRFEPFEDQGYYWVPFAICYQGAWKENYEPMVFYATGSGEISDHSDYFGYEYYIYEIPQSGNIEEIDFSAKPAYDLYDIFQMYTAFTVEEAAPAAAQCVPSFGNVTIPAKTFVRK